MTAWQPWQFSARVSFSTFCRMVMSGVNSSSLNATATGGERSERPTMLRVRKTPRWMGEVDLG